MQMIKKDKKKQARNKYRSLCKEKKNKKRENGRNRYNNMPKKRNKN